MIQSLLFMSGINTLLQTLLGTRLPTVMGPSFAYVISVLGIINDFSDSNFSSEHQVCKTCYWSEIKIKLLRMWQIRLIFNDYSIIWQVQKKGKYQLYRPHIKNNHQLSYLFNNIWSLLRLAYCWLVHFVIVFSRNRQFFPNQCNTWAPCIKDIKINLG